VPEKVQQQNIRPANYVGQPNKRTTVRRLFNCSAEEQALKQPESREVSQVGGRWGEH